MARYSKKQKEALEQLMKDEVYQHSKEILASEGIKGLTLHRLAKRIGISRTTLYNYFQDRDGIIEFIESRTFSPVLDELDKILDSDATSTKKIELIVRDFYTTIYENRGIALALSRIRGQRNNEQAIRFEHALVIVRKAIQQGIDSGEFIDVPAEFASEIVLGAMYGKIEAMNEGGELRNPKEVIPVFVIVILKGLTT